jgi:hypothetical protein
VAEDKSRFVGEGVPGLLDCHMVSKLCWQGSRKVQERTFFLGPWLEPRRRAMRRSLLGGVLGRALR